MEFLNTLLIPKFLFSIPGTESIKIYWNVKDEPDDDEMYGGTYDEYLKKCEEKGNPRLVTVS